MKKININWNRIVKITEAVVLILFFAGAAVLTGMSQANYKSNLTAVTGVNTDALCIEHNVEFQGKMINQNGVNKIKFNMGAYLETIDNQSQVKVQVWNILISYHRDAQEKLCVDENLGESLSNDNGMLDEIDGKNGYVIIKQMPETWHSDDDFLVRINYLDSRKKYVIPSSCVLFDDDAQKNYVYTIAREAKIWGTEYSLKKEYVKIVDSNGELTALEETPGNDVVVNAQADFYQGMLVKY